MTGEFKRTGELLVGQIDGKTLALDAHELRARLGCRPEEIPFLDDCINEVRAALRCRYAYRFYPVRVSGEAVSLGFAEVTSAGLGRALRDCHSHALMAVTLGTDVDRLLLRLSHLSKGRFYLCDAVASAFAEAACEEVERRLSAGKRHAARFSPGYADLPLTLQSAVLAALDAERRLGITLSESCLMSPMKSVTAIVGMKE